MADLTFRNLRADDAHDLHLVVSDWSVVRQLGGWPWPADPTFTRSRCTAFAGTGFIWAICLNDCVIGSIGVTNCSVGYMLRRDMHGQGIGTAALTHALATAFDDPACAQINATTWHDNAASHRVLTKQGFVHYRTQYERAKARGFPVLSRIYRLTRADWDSLRTAAQ